MDIVRKLKDIIIQISGRAIKPEDISEKTILIEELRFDSIQLLELITELENQFSIEFDDSDLDIENITSYKNLLAIIKNKLV